MHTRHLLVAALPFFASACSAAHELAPTSSSAGLEACLERGGALIEVGSVDNNDVHDHGALLTFGISPSGLLAAAGADGTLKFWSFDAELLATVDGSALTYGSEVGAVPITDLAFDDAGAIAGDVRGLVQSMGPDGSFVVRGGTTPDVPIDAVAYDASSERLAHAQRTPGAPLVVRGEALLEIDDTLETIRDLAFMRDGMLLVAGADATGAAVEVRDAADARRVVARVAFPGSTAIAELAAARQSDVAVAVSSDRLYVWRGLALEREVEVRDALTSVDLTPSGAFALSVTASGALVAHRTDDGREVARVEVEAPLQVRVDPTGQRVVVGSTDAILRSFACTLD